MKKTLLKSFLIALSILLSFTAISCSGFNDANNGKAYIVFSNERTLYPTIDTNNFSSITLTGKLNSGAEQTLGTWSKVSDMSGTSIEIDTGSWSFTLSATAEGLVYSGTTEKTIELGANELSFTLKFSSYTPVSGSSGTLNYTLTFPSSGVAVAMAGLYDSEKKAAVTGYEEESLTFTTGTASSSGTDKTISVSYSKTGVPSGNYYLSFGLFSDSDRTLKVGGVTEMIYIANGLSTTKTVALPSVNNPYNITYNLNGGTLTSSIPASYTVYSGKITLPTEMTKTDCKFGGWYTTSDFTGTAITEISEGSSCDITLYAKWYAITSITATLADSSHYELTSSTMAAPDISCFTITKTYEDKTTATETPTSATEIINADGTKTTTGTGSSYTAAIPTTVTSNIVGNIPVTITLASTATLATPVTCTVEVPYKYTSVAPECNKAMATAASIAQYTGSTTITTECKESSFTTYSIYSTGETMNLIDSVSYQWYSNTSNSTTGGAAISSATSSTYTTPTQTAAVYYYCVATTVCNGKDYCANATEALSSTSNTAEVAVASYTMTFTDNTTGSTAKYTLSNDQSVSLTQATSYTLALVNSADSTAGTRTDITWANATGFTLVQSTEDKSVWTITTPSSTVTKATLTASDGTNTLISVTIGTTASTLTLSKIEATYNGSALTAGTDTTSLPNLASFTVVKTYSDNTTTTTDSTATSDKYSIAWGSDSWAATNVGNRTLTVSATDTTITSTVTIPYKYAMVAPTVVEITTTSPIIAQYTGSTTLTAKDTTSFTTYTVYNGTISITDTVSYQWYSNTLSDNISGTAISGATSASYTVSAQEKEGIVYYYCVTTTVSGNSIYCYNTSPSTSSSANGITVTPWTMTLTDTTAKTTAISLSSGDFTSLTAGNVYTMSFANSNASTTETTLANSSAVSWTIEPTGFATIATETSGGWTFTAPAATSTAQSCVFTAKLTSGTATYTIGTFTGTVSAAATTGTTAITVTLAATSDIQVASSTTSGVVTLTADSDYGTYTWFINDVQQTSTTNVLTFTPATGVTYDVLLVAVSKTNGLTYSADIQVTN